MPVARWVWKAQDGLTDVPDARLDVVKVSVKVLHGAWVFSQASPAGYVVYTAAECCKKWEVTAALTCSFSPRLTQ